MGNAVTFVRPYRELAGRPEVPAAIDAIFYAASHRTVFASERERIAFRQLWLGQYLEHDPDLAFLAEDETGRVVGYIVGSREDPARSARFAELKFFEALGNLSAATPAHLHVNVSERHRGHGIGAALIDRLCTRLAALGEPGVHIVTGHDARNVEFYARHGFEPIAVSIAGGQRRLMMIRTFD